MSHVNPSPSYSGGRIGRLFSWLLAPALGPIYESLDAMVRAQERQVELLRQVAAEAQREQALQSQRSTKLEHALGEQINQLKLLVSGMERQNSAVIAQELVALRNSLDRQAQQLEPIQKIPSSMSQINSGMAQMNSSISQINSTLAHICSNSAPPQAPASQLPAAPEPPVAAPPPPAPGSRVLAEREQVARAAGSIEAMLEEARRRAQAAPLLNAIQESLDRLNKHVGTYMAEWSTAVSNGHTPPAPNFIGRVMVEEVLPRIEKGLVNSGYMRSSVDETLDRFALQVQLRRIPVQPLRDEFDLQRHEMVSGSPIGSAQSRRTIREVIQSGYLDIQTGRIVQRALVETGDV